jgi:hypothetical protein
VGSKEKVLVLERGATRVPVAMGREESPVTDQPQFPPHEAEPKGGFTSDNAKEMGAKGAAKRVQNLRDRATQTRQELALLAEPAAATLGQTLTSDA